MIQKRKITRATLDELAKRYPQDVISDEDARHIVGGTRYYSQSGVFLAQVGSGSDIRICDAGYATENLNGWTGSIESYYMSEHQMSHPQNWVGGITGNMGARHLTTNDGRWYDPAFFTYDPIRNELTPIDNPYVYNDCFSGCCRSFNYGDLTANGMPVPDFMRYSVALKDVSQETKERLRALNPSIFSDGNNNSDYPGGSGNIM